MAERIDIEADMNQETEDHDGECTVEELMNIITLSTGGMVMLPNDAMNLVYPGIYVGDAEAARSRPLLMKHGISHVLNTAKGLSSYHVNIHPVIYTNVGIKHMAIDATDMISFPLAEYFDETSKFIDDARKDGGKVLVHCREGVSRSATITIAYLMLKEKLNVKQAMREVRAGRPICPNDGFLQQLCDLNKNLFDKHHFKS